MRFETVNEYMAALPPPTRAALKQVRAAIKRALPHATEGISYDIPVYKLDDKMVLYIAGYREFYSIYPATPALLRALGTPARDRLHSKATLRFALDETVPTRLIARIAKLRASEVARTATTRGTKPAASRPAARGRARSSVRRRDRA